MAPALTGQCSSASHHQPPALVCHFICSCHTHLHITHLMRHLPNRHHPHPCVSKRAQAVWVVLVGAARGGTCTHIMIIYSSTRFTCDVSRLGTLTVLFACHAQLTKDNMCLCKGTQQVVNSGCSDARPQLRSCATRYSHDLWDLHSALVAECVRLACTGLMHHMHCLYRSCKHLPGHIATCLYRSLPQQVLNTLACTGR